MLISKFNKIIHNKMVWAAFAILVSLSMVGLFAPSVGNNGTVDDSAGTLFGKPVTQSELRQARLFAQAFQDSRGGEREQKAVQQEAWNRLAIQRYADTLGLSVSDQELTETISRDPSFAVNGAFSRQRYQQLIENQMRVPVSVFEDYLREELLLRKMQNLMASSLWIAPEELTQSVARFTDLFTIDAVVLSISNLAADVSAVDNDVKAFYDKNPDVFKTPEERSVYYVEWSLADLSKTVKVSETQIQDAYDRDIDKYSTTDTNTMAVTYTPLTNVAESIRADIAAKEAVSIGGEYAMQFLDDMSYDEAASIHRVAASRGMTVHTSAYFSASAPVPGLNVGLNFNQAAFQLDPAVPEKSFSRTVIGDEAVYVLAWNTNRPSFLQAFEDVKAKAKALADENARMLAFETRVTDIHQKLVTAVGEKKPFKETAEGMKLTVTTVGPFSVYDADPKEVPHFADMVPAALPLATGEIADPVRTAEATLIVYLAKREPGDQAQAIALRPEITRMLQSNRMRMHFAAWSSHLLATAKGTPKNAPAAGEPQEDEQDPAEVEKPEQTGETPDPAP